MGGDALRPGAGALPQNGPPLQNGPPFRRGGRAPPDELAGWLHRAVVARDDRAFPALLLAALLRGDAVDAGVLARGAALLADADHLAVAVGHLGGDVASALLAAVDDHGLGYEREPTALLLAELWCRRKQVPRPPRLLAEARIRARRQLTQEGEDAMVGLQGLLDDPDLATLLEGLLVPEVKDAARAFVSRLVERLVDPPGKHLPERAPRQARAKGSVRRATAKVGRNDACWCGSGKKYKSCHEAADRDRNADASDVAGLTMAELASDLERHLTPRAPRHPARARARPPRRRPRARGPAAAVDRGPRQVG
jgi:hypothetical protein